MMLLLLLLLLFAVNNPFLSQLGIPHTCVCGHGPIFPVQNASTPFSIVWRLALCCPSALTYLTVE